MLSYACHQQPTENLLNSSTPRDGVGVLLLILIRTRSRPRTQSQGGDAPHDGVRSLILILILLLAMAETTYSRGRVQGGVCCVLHQSTLRTQSQGGEEEYTTCKIEDEEYKVYYIEGYRTSSRLLLLFLFSSQWSSWYKQQLKNCCL